MAEHALVGTERVAARPRKAAQLGRGVFVLVLILVSFGVRLGSLDAQSIWRDEADSLRFAASPAQIVEMLRTPGHNAPLYYLLLHGWQRLAGPTLVAARLGNLSLAERFFRQAAEIDLANNMGNCAGGVHIAALGGLWQAAVLGFAGLSVREWGLELDPRLPRAWKHLRFHVTFHGTQIEFDVAAGAVLTVEARSRTGGPVSIAMLGGEKAALGPDDRLRAERAGNGWTWHNARE